MAYNGHKNWNHWNVSLWLSNDEPLYRAMISHVEGNRTRDEAARAFHHWLVNEAPGMTHTPDGAPYSISAIRAAMRGI